LLCVNIKYIYLTILKHVCPASVVSHCKITRCLRLTAHTVQPIVICYLFWGVFSKATNGLTTKR